MDPGRVVPIPLAVDINTEVSGGSITSRGAYIKNGYAEAYFDNRPYVRQRPSIFIAEQASDTVTDKAGRGIYYWNTTGALYFVNNNKIYKNSYANVVGTISAGKNKVVITELSNDLIIIDEENNEGWVLNSSDTLSQITDPDFPSTLKGGATVLDGYLFVLDNEGVINHSNVDDATSWNALNFIEAEREPDQGVYISKHHDHIVVMGTRTMEFFYNAANPTGSVLSRRSDIFYSLGADDTDSVFEMDDQIFFIGVNETGNLSAYILKNMKPELVSNSSIDGIITNDRVNNDKHFIVSGQRINGRSFYYVTSCIVHATYYEPEYTLVYDPQAKLWYIWELRFLDHGDYFPVAGTTVRTAVSPRYGEGIMLNGDIYQPRYVDDPIDTTGSSSNYVLPGYWDVGYTSSTGSTNLNSNIRMVITTNSIDGGGRYYKFMRSLEFLGSFNKTDDTSFINLRFSDDYYGDYGIDYQIPINTRRKLSRLGRFSRRDIRIVYAGPTLLRAEKLEAVIDDGEY